jgi:hypothetical protein
MIGGSSGGKQISHPCDIIAIIGSSVLLGMDFSKTAVRNEGIRKISREALARAGAIATPTPKNE